MTIGQAKAKPYWFALCLADVSIFLQLDTPLFVALISEGRLLSHPKQRCYQLENIHERYSSSCRSLVSKES